MKFFADFYRVFGIPILWLAHFTKDVLYLLSHSSVPYYYINSIIFCQYISVINFDSTEEGISLPRFEKLILYLVIMYIFLNYLLIVDKGAQKLYNI